MKDPVRAIADAVLYEGYLLWPYRLSSLKNRQRWTFGGLVPQAHAELSAALEPSAMHCAFLVKGSKDTSIMVNVRFLTPIERLPQDLDGRIHTDGLEVDDQRYLPFDEADEREVTSATVSFASGGDIAHEVSFDFDCRILHEPIYDTDGTWVATWQRCQYPVSGRVSVVVKPLESGIHRVEIRALNLSPKPLDGALSPKRWAELTTMNACHAIVRIHGGSAISSTDPPAAYRHAVEACNNERTWPVLLHTQRPADTVLCSPIILPDFPEVAPESPGDLYDATENDELLTLSTLALPENEQKEILAVDHRARALLQRTQGLDADDVGQLHGATRGMLVWDPQALESARKLGVEVGKKVVLRPRRRADVFDVVLKGKTATVVSIEQDVSGETYVTVAIDDDPGRDLGLDKQVGHRFFFSLDEIEPVESTP